MEIRDKKVLVLGGWGLVGMAVCKKLLKEKPAELLVLSLYKEQAEESVEILGKLTDIKVTPVWGNVFVPFPLKDLSREEILENAENREMLIHDVIYELDKDILNNSFLYQLINRTSPDIVIDCINSATALAYQDIFTSSREVHQAIKGQPSDSQDPVERMLITLYIPQLIRHIQILYEAMKNVKTSGYIKIGTSGTGGMGLNIPYTHSEEKPSRVLLSKSAVAGAHSMLLWLMARTPDAPITKEIKPTAAIAWKKIDYGEIIKGGEPVNLYDCTPEKGLELDGEFTIRMKDGPWECKDETLKSVYIDTGENGIFSLEEFSAITSRGQMEFITPEEIATNVVHEILGRNTGSDIMNALDNTTMGPTYRAGSMRNSALRKMRDLLDQHRDHSVAFELLGPPRLSKLLFEGYLLKRCANSIENIIELSVEEIVEIVDDIIRKDAYLRSEILSIGIPILLKDGKTLLRGPVIKSPVYRGKNKLKLSDKNVDKWADEGWVDLREKNIAHWMERFRRIVDEYESIPMGDTSSHYDRDYEYWKPSREIQVGKVVGWIFLEEEDGIRMKE